MHYFSKEFSDRRIATWSVLLKKKVALPKLMKNESLQQQQIFK